MGSKRKKPRENDLAERYRAGDFDKQELYEEDEDKSQRFSNRNKNAEQDKLEKTALLRAALLAAAEAADPSEIEKLPRGQVTLVYSLFSEVEFQNESFLCVTRKTLSRLADTQIVVGDYVHFRDTGITHESGRRHGVIESTEPRSTVLTRTDSFKSHAQHPIVANAGQMLIVASVKEPAVKWGLVDRMIVAAQSGGLLPIVCLNKMDLMLREERSIDASVADDESINPLEALKHYSEIGVKTIQTSVDRDIGLNDLKNCLADQTTVLAGHSGVGKSSLIQSIQSDLKLRIGEISGFTGKGRHTTTSARRYTLDFGGAVIDTPGVKMFGLWNITRENLKDFFPDVISSTAPPWRAELSEDRRFSVAADGFSPRALPVVSRQMHSIRELDEPLPWADETIDIQSTECSSPTTSNPRWRRGFLAVAIFQADEARMTRLHVNIANSKAAVIRLLRISTPSRVGLEKSICRLMIFRLSNCIAAVTVVVITTASGARVTQRYRSLPSLTR